MCTPKPPTAEMAAAARERAEQAAEERGVGIEQICIAQSCDGKEMHVFVLDEDEDERFVCDGFDEGDEDLQG